MKMIGVQHIGIAVKDLEASIENMERLFGIKCGNRQKIEASRVEVAFFDFGNTHVELVSPTDPASPVSRYLDKQGNGIHHICFDVEGIDEWLETLARKDVKLLNEKPRPGADGRRVAFIDPASAGGILFELSEKKGDR
jgi:methylmalonyl-CoA/ethylmalonyl-CoA epimerase